MESHVDEQFPFLYGVAFATFIHGQRQCFSVRVRTSSPENRGEDLTMRVLAASGGLRMFERFDSESSLGERFYQSRQVIGWSSPIVVNGHSVRERHGAFGSEVHVSQRE